MMVGIGTDLVQIPRMERAITRFGARFLDRLFTPEEQAHCGAMARPAACYAKRFAAKEALVKALGTGFRDGIWFTDITVHNDASGRPALRTSGACAAVLTALGAVRLHLSLSDEQDMAVAFVVVERD